MLFDLTRISEQRVAQVDELKVGARHYIRSSTLFIFLGGAFAGLLPAMLLQMLFGGILLLAVVAAVIVLITVSLNASQNTPSAAEPTPPATVSSAAPVATPTPTPEPTPTPTPTPSVTSITITFLGSKRTEFAAKVGDEVPLSTTIYPAGGNQTVTWSSKDESIATVSDKGVVTGVGKGTTTITAECGGVKADCTVYITAK